MEMGDIINDYIRNERRRIFMKYIKNLSGLTLYKMEENNIFFTEFD
jgi:hypothetical protein